MTLLWLPKSCRIKSGFRNMVYGSLCAEFIVVEQHSLSLCFSHSKLLIGTRTPHTISSLHACVYVGPSVHLSCFKISLLYSEAFPCTSTDVGAGFVFSLSLVQKPLTPRWPSCPSLHRRSLRAFHFILSVPSVPSFRAWHTVGIQIAKRSARWCPKSEK